MALKKGDEYIASLKSLGLEANVMGEKTRDLPDHPLVTPSVRAVASSSRNTRAATALAVP